MSHSLIPTDDLALAGSRSNICTILRGCFNVGRPGGELIDTRVSMLYERLPCWEGLLRACVRIIIAKYKVLVYTQ